LGTLGGPGGNPGGGGAGARSHIAGASAHYEGGGGGGCGALTDPPVAGNGYRGTVIIRYSTP
jgi:hypothetical protein